MLLKGDGSDVRGYGLAPQTPPRAQNFAGDLAVSKKVSRIRGFSTCDDVFEKEMSILTTVKRVAENMLETDVWVVVRVILLSHTFGRYENSQQISKMLLVYVVD